MKNFAVLGVWHVHTEEYARGVANTEGCRIAAVWDPDDSLAREWAQKLGCEARTLDAILTDTDIQGVIVTTSTDLHTEILLAAANAGKEIFTEKVLTITTADAEKVRAAVIASGKRFAISLPHYAEGGVRFAIDAARRGALGKLNYVRVRKSHNGATKGWLPDTFFDPGQCGGGAMIDLGTHAVYLTCEFLGEPKKVHSVFTNVTGRAVEDNAVSVMEFDGGAIGVAETGFVSEQYPFTVELVGDKGTLFLRGDDLRWVCPETGNVWTNAEIPQAAPAPYAVWASEAEIPADYDIDHAVRLTRVMEMAYKGQ